MLRLEETRALPMFHMKEDRAWTKDSTSKPAPWCPYYHFHAFLHFLSFVNFHFGVNTEWPDRRLKSQQCALANTLCPVFPSGNKCWIVWQPGHWETVTNVLINCYQVSPILYKLICTHVWLDLHVSCILLSHVYIPRRYIKSLSPATSLYYTQSTLVPGPCL